MIKKASEQKEIEVERIIQTLEKAIGQRRLKPGQRIIEAKIAEILKANRNHVQVALKRMAIAKIVQIKRNKGAFVAEPSAKEARDVFTARRVVELGIVQQITKERVALFNQDIQAHLEKEQEIIREGDPHKVVMILSEFHLLIAKVADNAVLSEILENLMVRSAIIEVLYSRNPVPACASGEHREIVEFLQAGDSENAAKSMLEHIAGIEEQLLIKDEKEPDYDLDEALRGID